MTKEISNSLSLWVKLRRNQTARVSCVSKNYALKSKGKHNSSVDKPNYKLLQRSLFLNCWLYYWVHMVFWFVESVPLERGMLVVTWKERTSEWSQHASKSTLSEVSVQERRKTMFKDHRRGGCNEHSRLHQARDSARIRATSSFCRIWIWLTYAVQHIFLSKNFFLKAQDFWKNKIK